MFLLECVWGKFDPVAEPELLGGQATILTMQKYLSENTVFLFKLCRRARAASRCRAVAPPLV
jgi:hypothetical protein